MEREGALRSGWTECGESKDVKLEEETEMNSGGRTDGERASGGPNRDSHHKHLFGTWMIPQS